MTAARPAHPLRVALVVAALALSMRDAHAQRPGPIARDSVRTVADSEVRVCAGGDLTLGTNLPAAASVEAERMRARAQRRRPRPIDSLPQPWRTAPGPLLAPLAPLVAGADLVLLNIEGAIGEGEAASKCSPTSTLCFAFRMPVAAAGALRRVAGDTLVTVVGNVANNHARDAGLAGFDSTVAHLARAGVVVAGADTLAAPAVTSRGDTVAVLGFATSGPGTPDGRDLDAVRRHVARAAARWPRVLVTMHLGAEGRGAQRTRDSVEQYAGMSRGNVVAFARTAVAAGADLVIGHGPHVLRAMEWQGDALVAYSLGNLVTYGPFSNGPPIDRGAVLCATLDPEGRPRDAWLRPTTQRVPGRVARDATRRATVLVDSLSRLDFPSTGVRIRRDGAVMRGDTVAVSRRGARPAARQGA